MSVFLERTRRFAALCNRAAMPRRPILSNALSRAVYPMSSPLFFGNNCWVTASMVWPLHHPGERLKRTTFSGCHSPLGQPSFLEQIGWPLHPPPRGRRVTFSRPPYVTFIGSRRQGQRPSISSTNVQLRKVRTRTNPARRPRPLKVISIAMVFTMSAATKTSRPSSNDRPIRILY